MEFLDIYVSENIIINDCVGVGNNAWWYDHMLHVAGIIYIAMVSWLLKISLMHSRYNFNV